MSGYYFFLIKVVIEALGIEEQQPWTPVWEREAEVL